jgi:predicted nucleic acid-binding Zn ribbon protein
MPAYEFKCGTCGRVETVTASTGSEAPIPECCDQPMRRIWNTTVHLLGEGWTRKPNDEIPRKTLPERSENSRRHTE